MFEFADFEKWRTLDKMREYFTFINYYIYSDEELVKHARLKSKEKPYKELMEEYRPLMSFTELH